MNLTPYHTKYFAYELTKRCSSDSAEKLTGAVASAQVDLNPHQVDAALFAFNSPLAKGALLPSAPMSVKALRFVSTAHAALRGLDRHLRSG
jgi:hypothetical protein